MQGIKIELGLRCSATHLEELSGNEVWGGMELNLNCYDPRADKQNPSAWGE